MGGRAGGDKGKEEEYNEDVKDSIGNILNNIVVLCMGTRLNHGKSLLKLH